MAELTPPIRIDLCDSERREPGTMLFTTRPGSIRNQKAQMGWVMGASQGGEMVLDIKSPAATQDVRWHQPTNTIFYSQAGAGRLVEVDRQGGELRSWYARGRWAGKTPPERSIELPIEVDQMF